LCDQCEIKDQCKTPCKAVDAILWADNRVMERHYSKKIVCYPKRGEVHFSELSEMQMDRINDSDVVPWSSTEHRLRKTVVFVERFFNKASYKELAERYHVEENTIVTIYRQSIEQLAKMIDALDARREGLKATKSGRFTDDEKMFLLAEVFGFNRVEVSRMFNQHHKVVCARLKRMSDRYGALFSGRAPKKEEIPLVDPPMEGKLTRADLIKIVEAYAEQGLSHLQAFKRIADRQAGVIGRPVNPRAVESRYRKAQGKVMVKSIYDGLTASEITERMTL
jgi:hypothetical protein